MSLSHTRKTMSRRKVLLAIVLAVLEKGGLCRFSNPRNISVPSGSTIHEKEIKAPHRGWWKNKIGVLCFWGGYRDFFYKKLDTAEKRQKNIEKQLAAAGVAIAEDIDYDVCIKGGPNWKKRMNEIGGGSDVTHPDKKEQNRLQEEYFKLEQERWRSTILLWACSDPRRDSRYVSILKTICANKFHHRTNYFCTVLLLYSNLHKFRISLCLEQTNKETTPL